VWYGINNLGRTYERADYTNATAAVVTASEASLTKSEAIYKKFQLGAAYTIPNIGMARLQYFNADDAHGTFYAGGSGNVIQAAFQYKPTSSGLMIDAGGTIPLSWKTTVGGTTTTTQADYRAGVATNSTFGDLSLYARFDTAFGGKVTKSTVSYDDTSFSGFYFNFHVKPSYKLAVGTVGLDFGVEGWSDKPKNRRDGDEYGSSAGGGAVFGFAGWFKLPVGPGNLFAGLGFRPYQEGNDAALVSGQGSNKGFFDKGWVAVPIVFDITF
jgi:hypothetical protein